MPKHKRIYRGVFHGFYTILKNEGVGGIQKGLAPAYVYQLIMNGVRFGGYDYIKRYVTRVLSPESYRQKKQHFFSNVLSGATSGTIGAALGSPFFLVKTRLQSHSDILAVGYQHRYKGMWDGLRSIYRNDGWRGIFGGTYAAMLRTGIGSSIQLSTYDKMRQFLVSSKIVDDCIFADIGASMTSGFFVCVGMNPFDVVSTRIYNQKTDPVSGRGIMYSGPIDCLFKTVKSEGVRGLFKGFFAHYGRIGPHTILCFVFLEQFRRISKAHNIIP